MTLLQAASYITAIAFAATLAIPVSMLAQAGDTGVRARDRYPQHVLSLRHQSVAPSSEVSLLVTHQPQRIGNAE
jgi:hypothetical protein